MERFVYLKKLAQYYCARLSDFLARAADERRRLKRREQLVLVMMFHVGIVITAVAVMRLFHAAHSTPLLFYILEGVIIVGCGLITVQLPALKDFSRPGPGTPREKPKFRKENLSRPVSDESEVERAEGVAGVVLFLAFLAQFGALGSLLWSTGGPIQSPFAELTLAIAVFTPFLANEPKTIVSVVFLTVVYYIALILAFPSAHHGSSTRTSVWAYCVVNVTILVGAITFSIIESVFRSARTEDAQPADPPNDQDPGIEPLAPIET